MDEATPAHDGRWKGPGDEVVRDWFPYQTMSPEEYVARYSHQIGCFSLDRYEYLDPELAGWLKRLGQIVRDPDAMEQCRRPFLTPAEYAAVQRDVEETMRHGL